MNYHIEISSKSQISSSSGSSQSISDFSESYLNSQSSSQQACVDLQKHTQSPYSTDTPKTQSPSVASQTSTSGKQAKGLCSRFKFKLLSCILSDVVPVKLLK